MAEEYEVPVDFKDGANAPVKIATTTTSSVASSSRMASAASAPVNLGNRNVAVGGADQRARGNFDEPRGRNRNDDDAGTSTPVDGNSFHSSPLVWNSSSPQRMKSRRELEQKIRRRSQARNVRYRDAMPKIPTGDDRIGKSDPKKGDSTAQLPLPKFLTDILLQTAVRTTAKISKPTLELTKNTLLPQIIIPIIEEIWELYAPTRLRTWMKVVPTSLKNAGNLLWDTEAGQALGEKAGQLGENVVDMASSDVARQCWIDATIALIKMMESLHTPEVKALLDQFAVGTCRFVDMLSSGKAKQVWFDASDALWALIEVGSDPVMVMSLAEGCAQICFALERERESLKQRRRKGAGGSNAAAAGGDTKVDRLTAAKKRRERDRRQMGTYPPGRRVVCEGEGRDGFEEALLDGLDGNIDRQKELEDRIFDSIDNIAERDGPPQRVMVPTNSSENIGGKGDPSKEAEPSYPNIHVHNNQGEAVDPRHVINDDSESEITTEIEDLRCDEDPAEYEDVHTQSSASEKLLSNRGGNALVYERDDNLGSDASLEHQTDQLDWRPNDEGTASEMYDAFEEPILQFYRRLNEVLVETRKQGNLDVQQRTRGAHGIKRHDRYEIDENSACGARAVSSPSAAPVSTAYFGIRKKWWKITIIASVWGVASMCMLWFALGCYGFYALFIGREHVSPPSTPLNKLHQPSNIVIQLVAPKSREVIDACVANADGEECSAQNNGVASISLDDWNKLKRDVDTIIRQTSEKDEGDVLF